MRKYKEMEQQIQKMQDEIVSLRRGIGILDGRTEEMQEKLSRMVKAAKHENKDMIMRYLKPLLQCTRAGSGIKDLVLDDREEYVIIMFEGGTKRVPVMGDSGIGLIQDVIKYLLK